MLEKILALVLLCIVGGAQADTVTDKYLWLEDVEGEKALDWVRAQNKRSLAVLRTDPRFAVLEAEALEILSSRERLALGEIHGSHVYNFWQDDQHVRGLWRRASLASFRAGKPKWETLIDVDQLAQSEARNWVFGNAECLSPAYERCLIGLSDGGTDASIAREYSIPEQAFVSGGFVLPEAKSFATWRDRDHLLVATDWGEGSMTNSGYPSSVRIWRRGTPLAEAREIFKGEASDVASVPVVYREGGKVYLLVQRAVTFYASEYHLVDDEGGLTQIPLPPLSAVYGVSSGRLIARVEEPWEYRGQTYPLGAIVALGVEKLDAALVFAPGAGEAVDDVSLGGGAVYAQLLDDVVGELRRFVPTRTGWRSQRVDLPDNGVVEIVSVDSATGAALISFESMTVPDTLFFVPAEGKPRKIAAAPAFYDASDVVVEQRFASSRDGTRVPYFLMAKRAVLAGGPAPTIQYGYGGFQASILPVYYEDPARPQHGALAGKLWVSRGGIMVLSNIRGGNEYGPGWHAAALRENRLRSFEDFEAIGEHLVKTGVTTPQLLGAIGRSNGGLLMGAVMNRRPDLYSAFDIGVPLLDMMRYSKLLAGASWIGEFGDPEVPADAAFLRGFSPYQNLDKDGCYPEVFFYTSTKDDRVHPGHARKMAAKMAEYDLPFLYYENIEGGHGGTANQEQLAFRTALEYAYFMRRLMKPD